MELESATRKDPILSKVLYYTRMGWPQIILKPYWNQRLELFIEEHTILYSVCVVIPGILHQRVLHTILYSVCIVIPGILHQRVLEELYQGHL